MSERTLYAGVDIGGTTTQAVLCDDTLTVLDRAETGTPATLGGRAMIDAALGALAPLLVSTPGRLAGVGVGAAGLVDPVEGRILVASDSFHGWAGFPVTAAVADALGVPAHLDNDVNAFLRGEVSSGAVRDAPDVLGITLGTGVGGALWTGGRLFAGPHGAAGEIGHIPGFGDLPCTCGAAATWRPWHPAALSPPGTPTAPAVRARRTRSRRRPTGATRTPARSSARPVPGSAGRSSWPPVSWTSPRW